MSKQQLNELLASGKGHWVLPIHDKHQPARRSAPKTKKPPPPPQGVSPFWWKKGTKGAKDTTKKK